MKIIIIIIGIIIFLLHTVPLITAKANFGNVFGICTGVLFVLSGLFLEKILSLYQTNFKTILIIIALLTCTFYIVFLITLTKIIFNAKSDASNENTIILLGCRVKGLIPTKALLSRCNSAYNYLIKNENCVCVLSGGQGSDEQISEAECMKEILLNKGINENRLFIENRSTSTKENLKYSLDVIKKNNLDENVLICTSEYHLYRARLIAKFCHINAKSLAAHSIRFLRIPAFTREVFGIWYLVIQKNLMHLFN